MKIVIRMAMVVGMMITTHWTYAACSKENHCHTDKKIVRCLYSKKDLKRIGEKNQPRLKEMGIAEGQCFYCGCEVENHSQE